VPPAPGSPPLWGPPFHLGQLDSNISSSDGSYNSSNYLHRERLGRRCMRDDWARRTREQADTDALLRAQARAAHMDEADEAAALHALAELDAIFGADAELQYLTSVADELAGPPALIINLTTDENGPDLAATAHGSACAPPSALATLGPGGAASGSSTLEEQFFNVFGVTPAVVASCTVDVFGDVGAATVPALAAPPAASAASGRPVPPSPRRPSAAAWAGRQAWHTAQEELRQRQLKQKASGTQCQGNCLTPSCWGYRHIANDMNEPATPLGAASPSSGSGGAVVFQPLPPALPSTLTADTVGPDLPSIGTNEPDDEPDIVAAASAPASRP
jgi:hypothetical protein